VIVAGVSGWLPLLKRVGPVLVVLFAYDIAVTVLHVGLHVSWISVPELPLPLLGSALGVMMGLRNNLAYNRWWEARSLWGAVANNSRSLVREVLWIEPDGHWGRTMVHQQIAWAHALRCRLRGQPPWEEIAPHLDPEVLERVRAANNPIVAIQGEQARLLRHGQEVHKIDSVQAVAIDRTLSTLADAQGGLERIGNTPLPRHFDHFPQIFMMAYCLMLPVGLVGSLDALTPIGSTIVGLIFLALDRIGRDLEYPFRNTVHDVPVSTITRNIEIDLRQMLGETDVPPPYPMVNNVQW
jgi:ion channel-forming bestrophin family protein